MKIVRRFLLAPSLARLIRKERGASRVTEGYFASQTGRSSYVLVEGGQCHLVLVTTAGEGHAVEERTEVPRAHAEALLDVCPGKAVYDRARLSIGGGREALVDRITVPSLIDLVSVEFEDRDEAAAFAPPAWFGEEVTGDSRFDRRTIALEGVPPAHEPSLSNAALDSLLDCLEDRYARSRYTPAPRRAPAAADPSVIDALRRLAGSDQAAPASYDMPPGQTAEAPAAGPAMPQETAGAWQAPDTAYASPVEPDAQAPAPSAAEGQAEGRADTRIDDVIANLSQALHSQTARTVEGEEPSTPNPAESLVTRLRRVGRS